MTGKTDRAGCDKTKPSVPLTAEARCKVLYLCDDGLGFREFVADALSVSEMQAQIILDVLVRRGLVECFPDSPVYRTTKSGKCALHKCAPKYLASSRELQQPGQN